MSDLGLVVPDTSLALPQHVVDDRARDRARQARELVDWLWPISGSIAHLPDATREQIVHSAGWAFYGQGQRDERGRQLWDEAMERYAEWRRTHGGRA